MNDFRIEIGFDWNGSFLPSGAVQYQKVGAPIVVSQHQFEVLKERDLPATIRFFVYDITARVDEAIPRPAPQSQRLENDTVIEPKSLTVVFQAARTNELISPFDDRQGDVPNPLTLSHFSSLKGTRHSQSCIFGNLRTRHEELPGWVGRRDRECDGKPDGQQVFAFRRPGVFLVNYMLVVGPSTEIVGYDRCFTTDPEWVVGGGEEPPDGGGCPPTIAG